MTNCIYVLLFACIKYGGFMKKQYNLKYIQSKKNRMQKRLVDRTEKYALQEFGADLYKKLENIERMVKNKIYYMPIKKYEQIKSMVEEYERTELVREQEREKQYCETINWLCNKKKQQQIEGQELSDNKRYILDLLYAQMLYLKKMKFYDLKHIYKDITKSFYKQNSR